MLLVVWDLSGRLPEAQNHAWAGKEARQRAWGLLHRRFYPQCTVFNDTKSELVKEKAECFSPVSVGG